METAKSKDYIAKRKFFILETDILKLKRDNEQTFSEEYLMNQLVSALPEIAGKLKIDNYTVMDSGAGSISPIVKFIQEIITILKSNRLVNEKN